jgi:hypothetical protein
VAWIERDIQCDDFDPDSVTCEKPTIAADGWEWVALYTTHPQRTWVGLTDEEVELYWDWEDFQCGCGPSTLFAMVRDIEARLKDRNI